MQGFVDVKDEHTGKLLFRYDPARDLVEIVVRGVRSLIDLRAYKPELAAAASTPHTPDDRAPQLC